MVRKTLSKLLLENAVSGNDLHLQELNSNSYNDTISVFSIVGSRPRSSNQINSIYLMNMQKTTPAKSQTPFDTFQFMKGLWLTDPDHENWWTIFPTLNTTQCRPQPAHIIVVNISPFFFFIRCLGGVSLSLSVCGWNVAYHIVVCKLMSILI